MRKNNYSIGIDFGTLSARGVLLNIFTGAEAAVSSFEYPHGVMDVELSGGTRLKPDWALQNPSDYLDAMRFLIRDLLNKSGVSNENIVGLGIDFTACSPMPIKSDGTPLCFFEEYRDNPHAYVKLWKHHTAQDEATRLNEVALRRNEEFLARYGGKVSSEWLIPKLWQLLNEAPDLYDNVDYFIEASDWLILKLTGKLKRGACAAGYKGLWHKKQGYPSKSFLKTLDPRLEDIVETKLAGEVVPLGERVGEITEEGAVLSGLLPDTAVAVPVIDAHVACAGAGISKSGQMLLIMGTSACHMLVSECEKPVPGICGVVEDGILPGLIGYEAGQSCSGDHFSWLVNNFLPQSYFENAFKQDISVYTYLTRLAEVLKPGESGILALDWWNGNRSVLVDGDLSGVLIGLTLGTKPEDIFRALIEATAFGTRKIIETFNKSGLPITELKAVGGIAQKNPFIMQVYSDVTGLKISVVDSPELTARSAAIYGAAAAGKDLSGFEDIYDAIDKLAQKSVVVYNPNIEYKEIYNKLYAYYTILHDYFGKGGNDILKDLKKMKIEQQR